MSKKKTSKIRNIYLMSISKIKDNFNLPVVFLIVILLVYITAHNLSSPKNIEDTSNKITTKENNSEDNKLNIENTSENTNINDETITADDIDAKKKRESTDNSGTNQKVTSFKPEPVSNLVNDNRGIPVLYYHSVKESADNEVTISPEMLKAELKYIHDEGYVTLTISQVKAYILNESPIPEKSILITFDDGYMDNYYSAFPILKEFNMTATIFCITSELDGSYYLSKEAIREMSAYGIDIESHTLTHPHLNKLSYDQQLVELVASKKTLEEITGKEISSLAYPYGDFNDDSVKATKEAGYTLGFTTKLGLSDRNDNPLTLDRIYISSEYDINEFKELLSKTKK